MIYNIGLTINYIVSGALFSGVQWGNEDDYNNIIWQDQREKPKWADILSNDEPARCEELRKILLNQIDSTTQAFVSVGFQFDNQLFSLSQNAQSNWNSLSIFYSRTKLDLTQSDWYIYDPKGYPIPTMDNGNYFLAYEKTSDFFNAALPLVTGIVYAGTKEKEKVYAMTTIDQLQAWKDSRL